MPPGLEGFGMHRTIFEFRYVSMNAKRRMLPLVLFGQEFQLTLTGVNQTPNVHLGLGPFVVEIQRRNSPRWNKQNIQNVERFISGIRMAQ